MTESGANGDSYSNGLVIGFRMIQVAIGITVGLFFSSFIVYSFGRYVCPLRNSSDVSTELTRVFITIIAASKLPCSPSDLILPASCTASPDIPAALFGLYIVSCCPLNPGLASLECEVSVIALICYAGCSIHTRVLVPGGRATTILQVTSLLS